MVNTSDRPITVDGVRLDTLAWNIEKINRATASRREADAAVPGRDGVIPSLNDDLDPAVFGLEMFVMGTDADGAVPGAGRRDKFRTNLDELIHLFGKRHALLEVRETVTAGVDRRAWAKVTDAIAPDVAVTGSAGRFSVALSLPYGVWEDVDTQDWISGPITSGFGQGVDTLTGGTETVQDAIILVKGPVTNPKVTDNDTSGAYVQLLGTLGAADYWRVNVGTWSTRTGTTLSLGSADTTGTDRQNDTRYGGSTNQAGFLPFAPYRGSGGARVVSMQLFGTGITTATRVSIRARRKYAL